MKQNEVLRVGVVGVGAIGRTHIERINNKPVSYTHLTLPTNREV